MLGDFIDKCHPTENRDRVPINIDPDVRKRLRRLLVDFPEFRAVGYSAFINRAVELAESEAMAARSREATKPDRPPHEKIQRDETPFKYAANCEKCGTEMGVNMYGMGTCPSCGNKRNPFA